VAMGILDALRLFLRDPVVETSLSTVQGTLRQAVSVEQMCQLASLGPVLYEVVVKTRMRAAEKLASADESKSIDECIGGPGRYSAEEQELWYVAKIRLLSRRFCLQHLTSHSCCALLSRLKGKTQGSACDTWSWTSCL